MIKSRFTLPYKNSKPVYTAQRSGTYLIFDKRINKIVYVGYSGYNLYKTLYRHFQSWVDEQYRAVYDKNDTNILVRVIYTTPKRSKQLEKLLIEKYLPRDNQLKILKYNFTINDRKLMKNFDNEPLTNNDDLPF